MSERKYFPLSLFLFAAFLALAVPVLAQYGTGRDVLGPTRILQGDSDRDAARAPNRAVDRRQQAQDQMQATAQQLDNMLVEVLEMVNRGEKPTAQALEAYKAAYEAARKYAPQFSDALKCETFLLWSWTEYFGNDIEQAFRHARNACDADRDNQDANATQAAMSILLGRAPLKIEPRRTRTVPGRAGVDAYAARQNELTANVNVKVSSGNILQLDVDAIDTSLLGKPVGPMKLRCVNGATVDYDPAQSNLCVLLWNIGSEDDAAVPGEPNVPGRPNRSPLARPTPQNTYNPRNVDPSYRGQPYPRRGSAYNEGYGRQDARDYSRDRGPAAYDDGATGVRQPEAGDLLARETAAYKRLFSAYMGDPRVSFVAVNIDPPTNAPAVLNKLLESPWPWANVVVAAPTAGAAQLADLKLQRPTLAIVSGGKIQYAGPAEGFLARMVLEHVAGEPMDLDVTVTLSSTPTPALSSLMNLLGDRSSGQATAPTPPAVQPEGPSRPQPPVSISDEEETELTAENYEAEKKLEYARKLFIPAGRKNILTSKRGIDLCREIIREYPNTKYEQEARLLLRQVPENERKRYNITDEELGL